ncbi:hypothetical protein [Streptomyces sp. NPDC050388]
MAEEEPEGRRTTRTWAERVALVAPVLNLILAIQKIVEEWVLPHV